MAGLQYLRIKGLDSTGSTGDPQKAQALRCHVCNSSTNCKEPQSCPASSKFCRTITTVEPLSGNLIRKDCADWCTPSSIQPGQVSSGSVTTECCQGDLCNNALSAGAPRTSSSLGPVLGLGLLLLILGPRL
ncbi:PREDICTED: lymphocyte antigen 6D isoform X1 [Dipodomys ordii]|uniref:Lymphocyte antigen 6D isoform X1 n=1 Tax=Dipodomys ordii TaxID=10020 RepID=A0A1S3FXP1_DIPOR|nr:PREDICTED: lymphocyte antigen 6D isoform X1 [Dipodomys ordii]